MTMLGSRASHEVSDLVLNGPATRSWSRFGPGDRTNADPSHVTGNWCAERLPGGARCFSDSRTAAAGTAAFTGIECTPIPTARNVAAAASAGSDSPRSQAAISRFDSDPDFFRTTGKGQDPVSSDPYHRSAQSVCDLFFEARQTGKQRRDETRIFAGLLYDDVRSD